MGDENRRVVQIDKTIWQISKFIVLVEYNFRSQRCFCSQNFDQAFRRYKKYTKWKFTHQTTQEIKNYWLTSSLHRKIWFWVGWSRVCSHQKAFICNLWKQPILCYLFALRVGFRLPFFEIEIFFDTVKSSVEEMSRAVQNAQNYCLTPKTRILRYKNVLGGRLICIHTLFQYWVPA